MKKSIWYSTILCLFLFSGCAKNSWQSNAMNTNSESNNQNATLADGNIPDAMSDWEIIADVSDQWFECSYGFILDYTKMSIDTQNRIWIYGPDLWNGPIGGITDNPGCEGYDGQRRIIVYDPTTGVAENLNVDFGEGLDLSSASGWTHLEDDRVILNSVFIYASPWDGPNGGKDNKFIDIAILEHGELRELISESYDYFSVPDYAISENKLYVLINSEDNPHPRLIVFDLETEQQNQVVNLTSCSDPRSIEASNENLFLLCKEESSVYSLQIFSSDFSLLKSWNGQINFAPELINHGTGFPLAVDAEGRVWVGYSYIVKNVGGEWVLETLFPDQNLMLADNEGFSPRPIFGMMPYKNMMLFSVDGAIFLADYDNKEWKILEHGFSPLPIAVGADGWIYVFTGKYIITANP